MGKVIYLTGAPASGKSSTVQLLAAADPGLLVWEYGARLTAYIQERNAALTQQDELRKHSASIVTPEDIEKLDSMLLAFVSAHRSTRNIIIDSHPVTKEVFGFRITPFSLERIAHLAPDEIWMLYASAHSTIDRITTNPAGRPTISEEEATFHTSLQAAVASTYGIALGRAVHLFDSTLDRTALIARMQARLS